MGIFSQLYLQMHSLFVNGSLDLVYMFIASNWWIFLFSSGEKDIPGLTDSTVPRRLGPKRASRIRKLFNLSKEDDVRQYVVRRPLTKEGTTTNAQYLSCVEWTFHHEWSFSLLPWLLGHNRHVIDCLKPFIKKKKKKWYDRFKCAAPADPFCLFSSLQGGTVWCQQQKWSC